MLTLWELPPSPNNTKVRMALRYKGVAFGAIGVDPADRRVVLEASGQEATPVIRDRGIVLNDSEAILQYLDANYRDAPRLFPATKAGRRVCDDWKRRLDERVASPWVALFSAAIGWREDVDEDARREYTEGLAWLDTEIGGRVRFHDDPDMAVCDLRVAQWATYAFPGPGLLARVPLFARVRDVIGAPAGSLPQLERFLETWNALLD